MWVIAGLGNPGRRYSRTRHNVGFMVIEEVASRHKIDFKEKDKYRIGRGYIGGHKGVESIIQNIGSKDFIRLKIGIGREEGVLAEDYVLSKFRRNEITLIKDTIQKAADAICSIVSEGVDKTMNKFN